MLKNKIFQHHFLVKFIFTKNLEKFKLNLGFDNLKNKILKKKKEIKIINLYKLYNFNSFFFFPELLNHKIKIRNQKQIFELSLDSNNYNLLKYKYKIGMLFSTRNLNKTADKFKKKTQIIKKKKIKNFLNGSNNKSYLL